jgi:predicted metal-dependent hydrolase
MDNLIKIDKIIRSKRRTISLTISDEGYLIVKTPLKISQEYLTDLIQKKRDWILKNQKHILDNLTKIPPKQYNEGESFLFLGESYKLQLSDQRIPLVFTDNFFLLSKKHQPKGLKVFQDWYKKKALEIFNQRAAYFSDLYNISYTLLKISTAKRQWGSCTIRGNLNINWRLIMAPMEVIDYVIIHELAHIIQRNHSSRFWGLVKKMMPEYEAQREWLRKNKYYLRLE